MLRDGLMAYSEMSIIRNVQTENIIPEYSSVNGKYNPNIEDSFVGATYNDIENN